MPRESLLRRRNKRPIQRSNLLLDATIRDFSGGWNVTDNDLNLSTKFAKKMYNMQRGIDGSMAVRPGTRLFAETNGYLDEIVNQQYYNNHIIVVGLNGKVVKITSLGSVGLLFDDDVANSLPGAPNGWSVTEFCSFAIFNGELTIHNGVNKPILIPLNFTPTFLNDPATGSNANTPIGKYAVTHGRYLVIAGISSNLDRLAISSTDTSGVFVGDPGPNDAVNVDLGSRVPSGSDVIKGIGRFRDKLIVAFEEALLPGTLGVFTSGGDHNPTFDDAIENHGAVSHRSMQTIGEDMLFSDVVGVNSVRRALFTGEVQSGRLSELIDPEIQHDLHSLKLELTSENRVFSIYDSHFKNYMLFIPNGDTAATITETRCFVFKKVDKLKIETWQEWRKWNFTSATRSSLKSIFLSRGTEIFVLGQEEDADISSLHKDYEGSEEMWSDDTPFTDYRGFTPIVDADDSGISIPFIWELPWSDAGNRFLTKQSKYINFDTEGKQRFTCQMFTDNIYEDRSDLGEPFLEDDLPFDDGFGWIYGEPSSKGIARVSPLDPTLSLEFVAGDSAGFGLDEYGNFYGGGRATQVEKLYDWPSPFKIEKLRFSGDGTDELKFVSITLAYTQGSPRR